MTHHARATPLPIRIGVLLLAVLLLFGLSPLALSAHAAASDGWKENIKLTGNFNGNFTLDTNTYRIFRVDNAAPGDSWTGTITIQNKADGPMVIALMSIVSELSDLTLFNALSLELHIQDVLVYSGSYGDTSEPVTPYYVVPAGTSLQLTATVAFPAHCGNETMGKRMNSTWIFDARYLGDDIEPVLYPYTVRYLDKDTRAPIARDKIGYGTYGERIIEYARDLPGYVPDASRKSITIRAKDNLIVFYYEKVEVPSEPTPPDPSYPVEPASDDPPVEPSYPIEPISDDLPVEPSYPIEPISDDPPVEPSYPIEPISDDPPAESSEHPGGVQTGNDLSRSNTTSIVFVLLILLCAIAILIVYLRIRSIKRRRDY